MKIKTQFYLLIAGILLVPLLLVIVQIVLTRSMREQEEEETAVYADLAALLDESLSLEDRENFTHFISRAGKFGNIVVFRKDLLVLYSTIPEFIAGSYESDAHIIELLGRKDSHYAYTFEAPGRMHNSVYILIQRLSPDSQPRDDGIRRESPGPQVRDDGVPRGPPVLLVRDDGTRWEASGPQVRDGPMEPAVPQIRGSDSRKNLLPFMFRLPPLFLLLGFFLLLILFAISMSLIIARSITKSVTILENATRRIAAGDLDMAVDVHGSNEITSLTNNLNKMRNTLKEEERRRNRLIMGVTHDLKTPLALIKAYAEAIDDGITEDPVTHTSAAEIITAKADQLEGMINDLLEFVHMDSSEWRGRLRPVNITAFLQATAKVFALDAELLRHEFHHEICLPENLSVPMDESLVLRALENLINNAIRYTPHGSVISLCAVLEGTAIRLTITDNGPGIAQADLPYIFDMFYRGTGSRREQGLGLGLAIVKWVTDSHGWKITANSDGDRTSFTITIPLEK
ncbi:MAG: HAMP domain-containing histidine kinase [Spirochaetaceae bacterium]|jgi:signal transduction histidine kinase|nr:HAMP domain-containing histidine kinase [Spirochaetaceae bacterium]